jgi:hypothetical protein
LPFGEAHEPGSFESGDMDEHVLPATAGFLLAGFVLSMFVSSGVWGALSPILPREVAIRGALVTGCVLFGVAATLGYLVSR